jgi:hypothetical protein
MSEAPKPPWETAALELGKLDYSLHVGKRCEIIQRACEQYVVNIAGELDRLRAARDECERQYQEKVSEIGTLLNERDALLDKIETERASAMRLLDLAVKDRDALAASVARLREVVEPMRRNFRMAHARNTDELKTLPTPYDDALDAAAPPPALAPDARIKEAIVRLMARCGPLDSWKKNERPELSALIIELSNLLDGPFTTEEAVEVGKRIDVFLDPAPVGRRNPRIHFLVAGRTLCQMPGYPANWPEGHLSSGDWREVNCEACRAAAHPQAAPDANQKEK